MKKIYFPGLNGIRAIACMMVFAGHFNTSFSIRTGTAGESMLANGVTCFFTLSGFLITSLLLNEKRSTGKINLPNFYLRRILRIWPLYFLILVIGWFALPYVQVPGEQTSYFLFYLFFLGNFAFNMTHCIWIVNPLWSVAVEEQFYAFWPLIVEKRRVLLACLTFLGTFLLVKVVAKYSGGDGLYYLLNLTRFDCMAIGGVIACLNFRQSRVLKPLLHPVAQWLAWGLFVLWFFRPLRVFSFIDNETFAILAGVLILNVSSNPRTVLTLENPVLNYLGKISYGLYAYNMPVLYLWHYFIPVQTMEQLPLWNFTLPFIVLGVNVFVAHCSYHYYEKWFLKVKTRFGHVSGPAAA